MLELTYTAWDLAPFARDHGDDGPPFRFDEERRFHLRAELDAAYFHLYGLARDEVDHVLGTFRAFRNTAPDLHARTRTAILERFDAMDAAMAGPVPYRPVLDPAPGDGSRHR